MEAQSDVEIDGEASRGQSAQVGPSLPLRRSVVLNLRHLLFKANWFFYHEVTFSNYFLMNLLACALIAPGYHCTRIHKNTVVACSAPSSWKTCLF